LTRLERAADFYASILLSHLLESLPEFPLKYLADRPRGPLAEWFISPCHARFALGLLIMDETGAAG